MRLVYHLGRPYTYTMLRLSLIDKILQRIDLAYLRAYLNENTQFQNIF